MNGVIIYRSETGFTRQYALWLAEELGGRVVDWKDRRSVKFEQFDTVIYGGWLHAGSIRGIKWFGEQLPRLAGKRTAVFAVGASPVEVQSVKTALSSNLSGSRWEGVARFYLQGGLNYERMSPGDRIMMAAFRQMIRRKEGADSETLRQVSRSFSALDRESLRPLLAWAKNE